MSLSQSHLAFAKAWAEGLDVVAACTRYLGSTRTVAEARHKLDCVLEELRSLARFHGRSDLVALLRRDPERMKEGGKTPTLEEFAVEAGEFWSEQELLEQFNEKYGASNVERRRMRLRSRLAKAVLEASRLPPPLRTPKPADNLTLWLDERSCELLQDRGVRTVGTLCEYVCEKGPRWFRHVRGMGPVAAQRITSFFLEHKALGVPESAFKPHHRSSQVLEPRCGLVPLERFRPPADPSLSGVLGSLRAPVDRLEINAQCDVEAVLAWLSTWPMGSTWRAYRSEAERLLLWCVFVRGKALSSLDLSDQLAYDQFLASPPADWIGPRAAQRGTEDWRPFAGPLGQTSRLRALAAGRSLLDWLWRKGYLRTSPWWEDRFLPSPLADLGSSQD